MAVVLTRGQKLTLERLNKNDFEPIKQADITRLLGKILDTESTAKEVVPKVIEYEKTKFPSKSVSDIQKYLTKKIKSKDDRIMFREVLSQGDYSSFPDVSKDTAQVKRNGKMFTEELPMGKSGSSSVKKPTKSSGTSSELDALLDKLLSDEGSEPEGSEPEGSTSDPFSGVGRRIGGGEVDKNNQTKGKSSGIDFSSIDFSSFFKEGSKVYKENKETIDKLKNALSKENLDSGAWFTEIASMEVPELKVLQQVVNYTPLGFSEKDKDNFAKMLSRDPDQMNTVSTSQALKTVGKMLVNPDEIGV